MKKILIIEDDIGISESLKIYLQNSSYKVFLCFDGSEALEKISQVNPDLIILDINLPGKNGIEITKEHIKNSFIPIIMLTARSSELDKIVGLEIGADDYIAKPFSPRELLARINTIFRRTNHQDLIKNKILFQNLELNLDIKKCFLDGEELSLTSNEYDILRKILEQNGKIVSRETIMKEVIGYDNYAYDRTIDTHIKNIRKKIKNKDIILTIRGEGYRLNN